jgi:DNA polymerase-3 subunit alpha
LIGLSGCLSGEVAYLIGQKDLAGATKAAGEYREIFGKDNYYLELQANGLEHQRIANDGLLEIHKKLDIPLAGTNDCHYLKKKIRVRTTSCSACRPARRSTIPTG